MKNLLVTAALSVAIGAGSLLAFTAPASAAIVCNRFGDCWRTSSSYTYRPSWGITVHNDNWRWHARDNARYRWRDARTGVRGYYGRNGIWIRF